MQQWPRIQTITKFLAKPDILFYALPWLMFLTVLGTVSQKYIGLYDATHQYFHSYFFWLGPVPLPGGLLIIGLIFISLLIKFLFYSPWQYRHAGIILSHLGILLLLLGGIVTVITSREGFMMITEGEQSNIIADYRARILEYHNLSGEKMITPFSELKNGNEIILDSLKIKVLEACENCSARAPSGIYKNLKGLAVNMELFAVPSAREKEANLTGLVFEVIEPAKHAGTYIIMENVPKIPDFDGASLSLKRAETPLPFSIALKDFRKIDYPGTLKAKDFESDLVIQENGISWPATIKMNEPLRYKGYTFYQSSFDQSAVDEITILNVVKNSGRLFPYISTLIIFAGLLLHLVIRMQENKPS